MASEYGDCATVLEQFVHDAANLPAEVNYMMEEIQAIDKDMSKYISNINSKDGLLQRLVKSQGGLAQHPKEQEFTEYAKKHYDLCLDLQKKKIAHSDKACLMLDRQLRKLDERILQLQRTGQMDDSDPPLPSVFNRPVDVPKIPVDIPATNMALQAASQNALNFGRNSQLSSTPTIRQPQPRQLSAVATSTPTQRVSAPATPVSVGLVQKQGEREHSVGADSKRRKLNMSTSGINLPSQPSGLRQSSIGPGTPKAGTPTGSRAGSVPRSAAGTTKKMGTAITKKVHNPAVTKLKNKHTKHARLSQSGSRRKAGSPAVRSARAGTAASEDSVLSSADASDTDNSQARRRKKKQAHQPEPSGSEDEGEDETDDKVYCYCNQPSFGEMVGCENPTCKREWFHISCLGLKTVPSEEHWFCPECRTEVEGQTSKKRK